MKAQAAIRVIHTFPGAPINPSAFVQCKDLLINTVASARWNTALSLRELFQQFISDAQEPLRRLVNRSSGPHRAKAAVLMRWDTFRIYSVLMSRDGFRI